MSGKTDDDDSLSLPDGLAFQIKAWQQQLSRIPELGLQAINANGQPDFEGAADVPEMYAGLPALEEVLPMRPSARVAAR